ncbi:MAG TPA: glycosyltransferase [Cyclobacteriaceae bacterium]|nr:glycosyltransferase [Cyclobacteriaceae bacterium]
MKTLLLVIPNLGTGGAQNVFRDQYRFYSNHYKTIGVVFNWDGALPEDKQLGIVSLDVPGGGNWLSKGQNFFKRIRKLKAIKASNLITHSISHLEGADYVNILSGKKEKIFCWLHGTKKFDGEIRGALGWLRKKVMMPLLYRRSQMIAVSEGIRLEMITELTIDPKQVRTILNGFDLEAINRLKNEPSQLPTGPILITHCRLAPQKNLSALIRIFTILKHNRPVKLVIMGDGELRNELISQATSARLSVYSTWNNDVLHDSYDVYFVGRKSNPYSLLSKATVYAMTSAWEGFPLSLGEAMACGLPSVASDCFTGPREILAPGFSGPQPVDQPHPTDFGILLPQADNEQHIKLWSQILAQLFDDATARKRYSDAAIGRMSDLDQKEISKKWLALIDNGNE